MSIEGITSNCIELSGQYIDAPSRACWLRTDGVPVTVEEFVGEYYVHQRRFRHWLLDASCVYGGLLWVLFHDLLFHDNPSARHPLRRLFYFQPRTGYERYREVIEGRLVAFARNRSPVLQDAFRHFHAHPLFRDPASRLPHYFGSWARRNEEELIEFCRTAPEHGMEDLVREILLTSFHGVNRGWPDLVVWDVDHLVFAEVKTSDRLSPAQTRWIQQHRDSLTIELVHVSPEEAVHGPARGSKMDEGGRMKWITDRR